MHKSREVKYICNHILFCGYNNYNDCWHSVSHKEFVKNYNTISIKCSDRRYKYICGMCDLKGRQCVKVGG